MPICAKKGRFFAEGGKKGKLRLFENDPRGLKISQNELQESVYKSTIRKFQFLAAKTFSAQNVHFWLILAIFGQFFWQFFAGSVA